VLQKLNADWSKEMIENIKNSKKLFILVDHNNNEELRKWVENGLKNYQLSSIELNIICPKYEKLTTILNEYQEEQSDFDPEKLSQRIISKL
jgi:5S rRNA maturation endonuclease (ribonuclease M5)